MLVKEPKPFGLIYLLLNKINNRVYVGQTRQTWTQRKKKYKSEMKNPKRPISKSLAKNGWDNYEEHILELVFGEQSDLDKAEIYYIEIFQAMNPKYGYNAKEGGAGGTLSQEARCRLSKTIKAKFANKENHPMFGKRMSDEDKAKASLVQKARYENGYKHPCLGKKRSSETRLKLSQNHADIRGDKNPFFGKTHSEEAKRTMSQKRRGRILTEDHKKKIKPKCPTLCVETNIIYPNIKEAAIAMNLSYAKILRHLQGLVTNVSGYTFKKV